jgi:hypothetical protein
MSVVTSDRALQARHYWRMMSEGVYNTPAAEFRDELEALAHHTTSPVLAELCDKNRRRFDGHISIGLMMARAAR